MKHVVAFDVSMGKSTMVMYDRYCRCEFEGEIEHTNLAFKRLNATLQSLTDQDGQAPEIVFEATGVFSEKDEYIMKVIPADILSSNNCTEEITKLIYNELVKGSQADGGQLCRLRFGKL